METEMSIIKKDMKHLYQHVKKKYGVKNVSQLEEIKHKKEQTAISHFGVKYTLESPELTKKYEDTCFQKYGHRNGGGSKQAIEKNKNFKKKSSYRKHIFT